MSLKALMLDPYLLAGLYSQPLIGVQAPGDPWRFVGENRKNVLILVEEPEAELLPENQFDLLKKMLSACKLDLEDVIILNVAAFPGLSYDHFFRRFAPKTCLLFGSAGMAKAIIPGIVLHTIYHQEGADLLYTESLSNLLDNERLKKTLWLILKQLFHL